MLDANALFRSIFMLLIAGLGAFHSSAAVQRVELNISISSIEADNSVTPSGTTWYTKALARLIKTVDQAAQDDGALLPFTKQNNLQAARFLNFCSGQIPRRATTFIRHYSLPNFINPSKSNQDLGPASAILSQSR